MPRVSTRHILALLGALILVCLAACAPTASVSVSPTATTPPAPTTTPTLAPAPTPTNVPSGWLVLAGEHFSLAYPPGWTPQTAPQQDGSVLYTIAPPDAQTAPVRVMVQANVPSSTISSPYCMPASSDIQRTTLAGLAMTFMLSGEGQLDRTWAFANAQRTVFVLAVGDAQSGDAARAQSDAILATFRPDDSTPWGC